MANTHENLLLLKNGFVVLPKGIRRAAAAPTEVDQAALGTVLANMAHYGYAPSRDLLELMAGLSKADLAALWRQIDADLGEITADNRRMGDHVIYKNFPKEVLEMSQAGYWLRQICMYIGFPNEWYTQEAEERPDLDEKLRLKVLDVADANVYERLFDKLRASGASWQADQIAAMETLLARKAGESLVIDLGEFGYRGNGVLMAIDALQSGGKQTVRTTSATDVLRIAAGMSGSNSELKEAPRFRKFSRPERRKLVFMLEGCVDLKGDFGRRPAYWKRLLERLHPGDFKAERVSAAYHDLYRGSKGRLSRRIELGFRHRDPAVFDVLVQEPGTFMRHLRTAYDRFGKKAFDRFAEVLDELTVEQLLKIRCQLELAAYPKPRLVRPNGSWAKAKVLEEKKPLPAGEANELLGLLYKAVGDRVDAAFPQGIDMDIETFDIRLATNGQELASFGRGTSFDIPAEARFVRTGSYWVHQSAAGNSWWDNSWNFFGEDWSPMGAICWDRTEGIVGDERVAAFSGDPTNSKDAEGRACQVIDLYLDEMEKAGVAYAVWSVLCYSNVSFSDADEVVATLQWGEDAFEGELFEPARAQQVFPLKGSELTKFVSYVDVKRRKLVYMDAPLPGNTESASKNAATLMRMMPAFQAYVRALPSVGDLFQHATEGTLPILRSDEDRSIEGPAYVMERRNTDNQVEQIDLEPLLRMKAADARRLREERMASDTSDEEAADLVAEGRAVLS